jgi:hypothetical protein
MLAGSGSSLYISAASTNFHRPSVVLLIPAGMEYDTRVPIKLPVLCLVQEGGGTSTARRLSNNCSWNGGHKSGVELEDVDACHNDIPSPGKWDTGNALTMEERALRALRNGGWD